MREFLNMLPAFVKMEDDGEIKMSIVMYTKPGCPYCVKAREYYDGEGIAFTEHDAMYDREHQREMSNMSRTVHSCASA